jgi:hypothetical protein
LGKVRDAFRHCLFVSPLSFRRWNFNGGGPSLTRHIPLAVGKPGAVVSLGGCVDQTIHADTAHIFSHYQVLPSLSSPPASPSQLPAHYVNLFLHSVAPLTEEQEQRYGTCRTGELTEDGLLCGCCDLRFETSFYFSELIYPAPESDKLSLSPALMICLCRICV